MLQFDLQPATDRMAELVRNVGDDQLSNPTPCQQYTLADLLDHVDGLSFAFAAAARKDLEGGAQQPSADGSRLGDDWRRRIPGRLDDLAAAWRDPDAWTGMTKAGDVDLPADLAAVIALDELVVHGWDVAKASGQPFDADADLLKAVHGFVSQFSGDDLETDHELFGPQVAVPDDAPLLDRVVALTGRRPDWQPH
jgi:uncharacterized protein (TIGR03086 family)